MIFKIPFLTFSLNSSGCRELKISKGNLLEFCLHDFWKFSHWGLCFSVQDWTQDLAFQPYSVRTSMSLRVWFCHFSHSVERFFSSLRSFPEWRNRSTSKIIFSQFIFRQSLLFEFFISTKLTGFHIFENQRIFLRNLDSIGLWISGFELSSVITTNSHKSLHWS